jgi:large subunit ribosomal protein L1
MNHSKRFRDHAKRTNRTESHTLDEAVGLVKEMATARFDETIELSARLGVDPRKSDQMVRGTVVLPHGSGKSPKILVLTQGEKEKEATEAGADFVGFDEYVEKIGGGWVDVDAIVATPDVMSAVGKLGKILGPRGLMPNPKTGTVTMDVEKAVMEIKKGKIEYRVDKTAVIHVPIGKASFDRDKLYENAVSFLKELIRARPSAAKGTYLKSIYLSSTMSPGVRVDTLQVMELVR